MGLLDQDSEFVDWYEQSEQYQIDQVTFNDWQTRVYDNGEQLGIHFDQSFQDQANAAAARLNALQNFKDAQTQKEAAVNPSSEAAAGGSPGAYKAINNAIMNSDQKYKFHSDLIKVYHNKWQENFQYILGPANPAFIDATLSYQDIAYGYTLEYNSNGILWRVSAAGIPHPDDYNNFIEQQRVIESTTERTSVDIQAGINPTDANPVDDQAKWNGYRLHRDEQISRQFAGAGANRTGAGANRTGASENVSRKQYVTAEQLRDFGWQNVTEEMVRDLNNCLIFFNITTPNKIRHFLAQSAKETGFGRDLVEDDGGDPHYFDGYEPGTRAGKELGNTEIGDGKKFRGTGFIQVTGRWNYQKFSDDLKKITGKEDPLIMERGSEYVAKTYPWTVAGWFWDFNDVNIRIDSLEGSDPDVVVNKVTDIVNKNEIGKPREDRVDNYRRILRIIPD